MGRKILSVALAVAAGFVLFTGISVHAAPVKNQSATTYLSAAAQNPWTTQALYFLAEENISSTHLQSATCTTAIACAAPILGITALGEDPRTFAAEDLVAKLQSFANANQLGETNQLNDDVYGILALISAGVSASDSVIVDSKNYILANQNPDGSFGWSISGSSIDDTAASVMALLEAGVGSSDTVIINAINSIKALQNSDGGFPYNPAFGTDSNSNSTAFVISMVYKLGQDPESTDWSQGANTPVTLLNSLQATGGYFGFQSSTEAENGFSPTTTAQAAIALAGGSYPVKKITYPIPTIAYSVETLTSVVCSGSVSAVTAMDAVRKAAQDTSCGLSYDLGWFSFGQFLADVNGLVGAGSGIWWKLLINGVGSSVGGEDYGNTAGDSILWFLVTTVPAPEFFPVEGEYMGDQEISITIPDQTPPILTAPVIYYTTDGTTPNTGSTLYTEPITLSEDTTINAIAYDKAGNGSAVVTAGYSIMPFPGGIITLPPPPSSGGGSSSVGTPQKVTQQTGISASVTAQAHFRSSTGTEAGVIDIPDSIFSEPIVVDVEPIQVEELSNAESSDNAIVGAEVYDLEIFDQDNESITQFDDEIMLTFHYSEADIPAGVAEEDLQISYFDEEEGVWWALINALIDTTQNIISAPVTHFTLFGITYGVPEEGGDTDSGDVYDGLDEEETDTEEQEEGENTARESYPDGTLIKTKDDPTVYLIENGRKRWVPNDIILDLRFKTYEIEIVEDAVIDGFAEGLAVLYPSGVYLQSDEDGRIYRIKNNKKYHVLSLETWQQITDAQEVLLVIVDSFELQQYPLGGVVQ